MLATSTRLPVRSAAIALAALLMGSASCAPTAPAVPAPTGSWPTAADALTLTQLERLWADIGDGGGYRSTTNLAARPSLYLTSWTLRLVGWYRAPVPQLSRAQ